MVKIVPFLSGHPIDKILHQTCILKWGKGGIYIYIWPFTGLENITWWKSEKRKEKEKEQMRIIKNVGREVT